MYVKHLQEYLDKFTNGRKGNAVSNAKIFIHVNGYLEEIKRIEVQEHAIGTPGAESIRVVLKPNKEERLIFPPGYIKDYKSLALARFVCASLIKRSLFSALRLSACRLRLSLRPSRLSLALVRFIPACISAVRFAPFIMINSYLCFPLT